MSILRQILVAGTESTANTLASGLGRILQTPGEAKRLKAQPEQIPNAVEEILRFETPAKGMWRVVTEDVELGGIAIPAGALLMLSYEAANHDPAEFPDPDRCIFDRANANRHLAFGGGTHFCIGAQLAKKELTVAFARMTERLLNLRLAAEGNSFRYAPGIMARGPTELWIEFDPVDPRQ